MIGRVLSPDHLIGSGVAEILIAVPAGNHEHFGREVRLSFEEKQICSHLIQRILESTTQHTGRCVPGSGRGFVDLVS